jgi:hypothetical protein
MHGITIRQVANEDTHMTRQTFTLIDEAHAARSVDIEVEGQRLFVDAAAFESATGWSVKPEGFCQGPLCVPAGDAVDASGRVDIARFAARLGRPLVIDAPERALSLGAAAATRADALQSLEAPDFTLPDLTGKLHSLSDYRGKKVLLAAYASW